MSFGAIEGLVLWGHDYGGLIDDPWDNMHKYSATIRAISEQNPFEIRRRTHGPSENENARMTAREEERQPSSKRGAGCKHPRMITDTEGARERRG